MIFGIEAPRYWAKGLAIVPANGKRPIQKEWNESLKKPPSEEEKKLWLAKHQDQNIALLPGSAIGDDYVLLALDFDDDIWIKPARALLGQCPSGKRGKKGETIFVRARKSANITSTVFTGHGNMGNLDVLCAGKCTIIPPSIHPDTQKPYEWVGIEIVDCDLMTLPEVTPTIMTILKMVMSSEHTSVIVSGQSTNEATLKLTGALVALGASDDQILSFMPELFPKEYGGNSLVELAAMIDGARKKGFGDQEEKSEERKQSEIGLAVVEKELHLFKTELGEAFAEIRFPEGARVSDKINSPTVSDFIEYKFYLSQEKPISPQGLNEVKNVLTAKAKFTGPTERVWVRKAYHKDRIYIDLGRKDGKVVEISADGWEIITNYPVRFRRPLGFGELPLPARGGSSTAMYDLFGLKGPNVVLRLAFELTALSPDGPYFVLMTQGSQGSGKTKQNESIKNTIDPSAAPKLRLPKSERNLAVQARDAFALSYDNASNLKWEMSDVLCTVATGGGLITRELYTDDGAKIFTFKRPLLLNGIGEYADRPDLLERSLQLDLARMPKGQRRSERSIDRAFLKLLPQHLGFLYDCVACGLANVDDTPEVESIRMSDAAQWLCALEPATLLPEGTFLTVIENAQNKMLLERIENNILCIELLKLLRKHDEHYEGTVGKLHSELIGETGRVPPGMPKTPSYLSQVLTRLEPMLEVIGIFFEFQEKDRDGRPIKVWLDQDEAEFFPELPERSSEF